MQSTSGWDLLNAIAYPAPAHRATIVTLELSNEGTHPNETRAIFRCDVLDNHQREVLVTDGTGVGAEYVVTPGVQVDVPGANCRNNPFFPTRGDIALYHELAHAYHFQRGAVERNLVTAAMAPYDSQDVGPRLSEYQATGLNAVTYRDFSRDAFTENRYRAERRAMGENAPSSSLV